MTILTIADIQLAQLQSVLGKYNLTVHLVDENQKIPGSWFGEPEAGIIENNLYIRNDTPVHSALHEASHYTCMAPERRDKLHTNAGGDYDEENGVCYLSLLLSNYIDGFGINRMFSDMDEWGYTFRLGSSRAWFEEDAKEAFDWLFSHEIISKDGKPDWKLRSKNEMFL